MNPLDKARLEKFISTILKGEWRDVLSYETFVDLTNWLHTHKDEETVAIRFAFFEELDSGAWIKHAMHIVCSPIVQNKKVNIQDIYLADEGESNLLAMPPDLYEKPLFCIPDSMDDLLDNMD